MKIYNDNELFLRVPNEVIGTPIYTALVKLNNTELLGKQWNDIYIDFKYAVKDHFYNVGYTKYNWDTSLIKIIKTVPSLFFINLIKRPRTSYKHVYFSLFVPLGDNTSDAVFDAMNCISGYFFLDRYSDKKLFIHQYIYKYKYINELGRNCLIRTAQYNKEIFNVWRLLE